MKALEILNALKESGCFVGDIDEAISELETLQNWKGSTLFNFLVQQIIGFKYYRNPFENGQQEQYYFKQLLMGAKATTEELNLLLVEEEDLVERYKETILLAIEEQSND